MPYLYQTTGRRQFIKTLAGGVGAIATMGVFSSFVKDENKSLRFAFFSDTHIPADKDNHYRGFYMVKNLKKIVPQIVESEVHSAIITGDLARLEGKQEDYKKLKQLLDPLAGKIPVAMALGNHDRRDHFLEVFPDSPGERQDVKDKYVLVLEYPGIRFIILDSLIYTNHSPALGLLGIRQREWLEKYLKDHTGKPVLLFVHHTLGERDGDLQDADRMFKILQPLRHVKAIVYGHSHVYGYSVREGIHLINLPATGYNFGDQDPVGWVEATITAEKGIFTLHATEGNTQNDGAVKELTWRI